MHTDLNWNVRKTEAEHGETVNVQSLHLKKTWSPNQMLLQNWPCRSDAVRGSEI